MASRSYSKAVIAAQRKGMDPSTYEVQTVDLASLDNVRQFVNSYKASGRPLDALVCNAAVWYPQDKAPRITPDGYEEVRMPLNSKKLLSCFKHGPLSTWHTHTCMLHTHAWIAALLALLPGIQEAQCLSLMLKLMSLISWLFLRDSLWQRTIWRTS